MLEAWEHKLLSEANGEVIGTPGPVRALREADAHDLSDFDSERSLRLRDRRECYIMWMVGPKSIEGEFCWNKNWDG